MEITQKVTPFIKLISGEKIHSGYRTIYKTKGYLVLTNSRILFLEERGHLRKSFELKFAVNLEDLLNTAAGIEAVPIRKFGNLIGENRIKFLSVNGIKFYPETTDAKDLSIIFQNAHNKFLMEKEKIQTSQLNTTQSEFIYCTHCGYKNDTIIKFCKNCGIKVDE
ncbi:MAG TPA: hypothetical protein VMV49_07020 [Candidatus Deferrimicrobium sp.]|nr:hypothetical protein [Candidatus Deferrimicrobium sp.]